MDLSMMHDISNSVAGISTIISLRGSWYYMRNGIDMLLGEHHQQTYYIYMTKPAVDWLG